ncbi:MAG: polymer-forming cytoskeletal protein [Deltaproteobacteria bacterium]|nr:polymer-forming cytoskeletal protein [Deltaproteobacteria bacterium]MBI3076301.1 polymer-forming cytoskeletal protein [Deltaproteobacteria bacterium]
MKGEVSGEEDLLIEGAVEGKITLNEHSLWIGKKGRIQGEVQARTITILGQVTGPLTATERVEIRASATVVGDIVTQRIVIEEGARFKGSVDTGTLGNNGSTEGVAEAAVVGRWGGAASLTVPDDLRQP